MFSKVHRAYFTLALLAGASVLGNSGCATDRPSRNGVFNENQYLRKDFLIAAGDGSTQDEGWLVKNTVISTSTPNPLGQATSIWADAIGGSANYVRFAVTQDKLQMLDLKEISNSADIAAQGSRQPSVVNAWSVTNVDLKYRVNLDGERTNFYEENQELDWQQRQWVKLNFAKNDLSDLYAFNAPLDPVLQKCTNQADASVTLVPGSFNVDTSNGYFEFSLDFTLPIAFSDTDAATCLAAFGPTWSQFQQLGRQNVSFRVKSSFVRPSKSGVINPNYIPFDMAEKDPILRKYGLFRNVVPFRDYGSSLLGATQRVIRWDPTQQITYYFAPGVPDYVKDYFMTPNTGLQDLTNSLILSKSGSAARVKFLNYNDKDTYKDGQGPTRLPGDVRYSFVNWHNDLDTNVGFLGVDQPFAHPITGQLITSDILIDEYAYRSELVPRIEYFLTQVGSEVLGSDGEFDPKAYPATCKDGDQVPVVPDSVAKNFNRSSTVFNKIQAYLARPFATNGYLGPADFLTAPDADFLNAYYKVLPYQIYTDPQANLFTTPDATPFGTAAQNQWQYFQTLATYQKVASDLDHGKAPFDIDGASNVKSAVDFYSQFAALQSAVADYAKTGAYLPTHKTMDSSIVSYFDVFKKAGRRCIGGAWETRAQFQERIIRSVELIAIAHEFGHGLGLAHNFMGNIDQRNFPLDANGKPIMYSSSIMEYQSKVDDAGTVGGNIWGPYDIAAIGFIYGNNYDAPSTGPKAVPAGMSPQGPSGQVSKSAPWNDPLGFEMDGTTEHQYLYCGDEDVKYTPLCQQSDVGVTPSEIVANAVVNRELNYLFTNFRLYKKYYSTANYGTQVATDFSALRRFQAMWDFDWSGGELTNTFRLVGVKVPTGANAGDYYNQLNNKFSADISIANQLAVAYQRAIVDQGSGERPYITVYDPYFGDVTQQGIQLDKVTATNNLTSLWLATESFDPSQATGAYITSVGRQIGDSSYTGVSTQALTDFLGAAFATFSYAQVGPIATFAAATQSVTWPGDLTMRDWVGGWAFNRERDFLDFLHASAAKFNFQNCDENGLNCQPCTSIDNCTWDPRTPAVKTSQATQSDRYNRFQGPDGRTYIWGYIRSRNQWVLADKDRNTATYALFLQWTTDLVNGEDSGYNGASGLEYRVRYVVDNFTYYNGSAIAAP